MNKAVHTFLYQMIVSCFVVLLPSNSTALTQKECPPKSVVVPLTRCADGLTNCSGRCIDTFNNPDYCGDCATDCGTGSYCTNGICKNIYGKPCTAHSECLSGYCEKNFCSAKKTVFVTSVGYPGNLGGSSGADSICQAHAGAVGLQGTYRAWLSDSSNSPETRFVKYPINYALVDGTVIAHGWSDLVDGTLDSPINLNEYGLLFSTGVWTGTSEDGQSLGGESYKNCSGWTVSTGPLPGSSGVSDSINSEWTNKAYISCDNLMGVYCFEQ